MRKSRQRPAASLQTNLLHNETHPGRTNSVATTISKPVTSSISTTAATTVSRPVTSSTTAATTASRPMTSSISRISTTAAKTVSRPVTSSISFLLAEEEQQDYEVRKNIEKYIF